MGKKRVPFLTFPMNTTLQSGLCIHFGFPKANLTELVQFLLMTFVQFNSSQYGRRVTFFASDRMFEKSFQMSSPDLNIHFRYFFGRTFALLRAFPNYLPSPKFYMCHGFYKILWLFALTLLSNLANFVVLLLIISHFIFDYYVNIFYL